MRFHQLSLHNTSSRARRTHGPKDSIRQRSAPTSRSVSQRVFSVRSAGHRDDPDFVENPSPSELIVAQERMNDLVLSLLDVDDGMYIADVGCGFGGSLEVLNEHHNALSLIGLNIDRCQIEIAQGIQFSHTNSIMWLQGDGCKLPMRDSSLDRVLCLEALPHFDSRDAFFGEMERVLRPGGLLALADLLILPQALATVGMTSERFARMLDRYFGPWISPFDALNAVDEMAERRNLQVINRIDATRNTAPTFRVALYGDPTGSASQQGLQEMLEIIIHLHRLGQIVHTYTSYRLVS
ncbi:MAG: methyltransferase domain-containing protein [Microthrixaceae bacterium]